jgi:competence protein ComGC
MQRNHLKGQTPVVEMLGIVSMIVLGIILLLMIPKLINEFLGSFAYASAEIVARDIASLVSLSKASLHTTSINYNIPTEVAKFKLEFNNRYLTVLRIDNTYCKDSKLKEFCKSFYPILFDLNAEVEGKNFEIKKQEDEVIINAIE